MNRYEIAQYVDSIAQDIMAEREHWDADDLHDIAHEHADGSQYVIYYALAHEFVQALDGVERNEAETRIFDFEMKPESYDEYATQIAYFALYGLSIDRDWETHELKRSR